MRAIHGLSILNYDFICILDRNMRVFPHDVMAAQGLRGQVTDTWISIVPERMMKKVNALLSVSCIWEAWVWPLSARVPAIIGVNWNFDTD